MKMQYKTEENDVSSMVKYDMPWPWFNILPNCDHTKIMCPNCAHQTGMLYEMSSWKVSVSEFNQLQDDEAILKPWQFLWKISLYSDSDKIYRELSF